MKLNISLIFERRPVYSYRNWTLEAKVDALQHSYISDLANLF